MKQKILKILWEQIKRLYPKYPFIMDCLEHAEVKVDLICGKTAEQIEIDIIRYFLKSGYSRIPMDYASKWAIENLNRMEGVRSELFLRPALESMATKIMEMSFAEARERLNLLEGKQG